MASTASRTAALTHIPAIAELAALDQWVLWKYITRRGRQDKPPFSPRTGAIASHSDPAQWASYAEALSASAGYSGVGFVFSAHDPYTGVDLDDCLIDGELHPAAARIIDSLNSYSEISPSGTGVKVFVRGQLPGPVGKTQVAGAPFSIEVYAQQRYFTVTGQHLPGTPLTIRDATGALAELYAELRPAPAASEPSAYSPQRPKHTGEGERVSARAVIDGLNRVNDLGDYLVSRGATLVRTVGDARYYSGLRGDAHDHSVTYVVSPARDDNGQIGFSYSSRGQLCNVTFRRGFRWFDAVCALEYGGSVAAALKALNPLMPRRAVAQAHDSQRHRERRRQAADAALEAARCRAASDKDLTGCDRAVLQTLLLIAAGRGWCRPSKERIAELSGYSLGGVKRSLMTLEARGYFQSEGDGGAPGQTAIRTFVRGSSSDDTQGQQAVAQTFVRGSSGGAPSEMIRESCKACDHEQAPAAREPGLVEQQPLTLCAEQLAERLERLSYTCYIRSLAAELGIALDLVELGGCSAAELCQIEADLAERAGEPAAPEASAPLTSSCTLQAEPATGNAETITGASYSPTYDWTVAQPAPQALPYTAFRGGHAAPEYERPPWMRRPGTLGLLALREERAPEEEIHTQLAAQPLASPTSRSSARAAGAVGARDRYRADVALMSAAALAGELKKQRNIIAKHGDKRWLDAPDGPRRRLAILLDELARRAKRTRPQAAPNVAQPAQLRSAIGVFRRAPAGQLPLLM